MQVQFDRDLVSKFEGERSGFKSEFWQFLSAWPSESDIFFQFNFFTWKIQGGNNLQDCGDI